MFRREVWGKESQTNLSKSQPDEALFRGSNFFSSRIAFSLPYLLIHLTMSLRLGGQRIGAVLRAQRATPSQIARRGYATVGSNLPQAKRQEIEVGIKYHEEQLHDVTNNSSE